MDLSFSTENASFVFGTYDRIKIEGIAYKVHTRTEVGYVFLRDDGPELAKQYSHQELARLGSVGRIRVERDYYNPMAAQKRQMRREVSISGLMGAPRRRVTKKEAYCEAFYDLRREDPSFKITDSCIKARMYELMGRASELADNGNLKGKPSEDFSVPPSARTLRRWLADYAEFGMLGLVDEMSLRGIGGRRMGPEEISLMMKEVRGYLSRDKPTIKQIAENVELAFRDRNEERAETGLQALPIPCRETVRRAIRGLDPFRVEVARNGEEAARKKFRPVTNGLDVTRPLERVEIDEWTVDVMTLLTKSEIYSLLTDEEKLSLGLYVDGSENEVGAKKRKKKDRWTLTAAICYATRCIVGMVLSRKPNAEAAVQLLQMITTNKGAWSNAAEALTPWDMFGTPELIVFDGGNAFKSQRFRIAAEDLGVSWEMAMNGVPENRGTIERVFGTFAQDFAPRLSGHTFGSIMAKGSADPSKRAALTLDDFTFCLIRYVVDIYHNAPHQGLHNETPVQAWRRLSKTYGVTSPPDMEMQRICFGKEGKYRLDKTGISILGVTYQSDLLQDHLRRKGHCEVSVRWHPKNIGGIAVYLNDAWFTIPSLDPSLEGVAAQTWLTAVRHVKAAAPKSNRLDNIAVRNAIKAISDRNAAAMAAASLNLEDWSDERLARDERNLLAGVEFYDRKAPEKVKGQLGRSLPTEEAMTGAPSDDQASYKAGGNNAPEDTPKSNFSIEED